MQRKQLINHHQCQMDLPIDLRFKMLCANIGAKHPRWPMRKVVAVAPLNYKLEPQPHQSNHKA